MMPRVSFSPGVMQSLQAATYFNGVIAGTLDPWLERWGVRQYVMEVGEGPRLQWRIWSLDEWAAQDLGKLFVWLLMLRGDVDRLLAGGVNAKAVGRMVDNWSAVRHDHKGFFLEETVQVTDDEASGEPRMALAVLGGRTVMLSTNELLFTRLGDGLHGLALAGEGSYLVEEAADGPGKAALRMAS